MIWEQAAGRAPAESRTATKVVFVAKLAPNGATQESPGCKPWEQVQQQMKPCRAKQFGAGSNEAPDDEHLSELRQSLPPAPFRAFCNLDLEPGAYALG